MAEPIVDAVKRLAIDVLEFDLVGVTDATPLSGETRLRRWLAAGFAGGMAYLERTGSQRARPSALLPGARSVICVAMSYHERCEPPEVVPDGSRVVVARYARRRDYHKVLRSRLARMGRFLAGLVPGLHWRIAVDTAPLLEKELAARAGLGWQGSNTLLINRALGSELLLGELITDAELPPDKPASAHCGRCRACLEACPTRALVEPGLLDARMCIAYLTIEHHGGILLTLRRELGSHLFGCDICQAVCPWNHRARERLAPPLATRPGLVGLPLEQLEATGGALWATLSAGTPLRRLDQARLTRNLAIVRANIAMRSGSSRHSRACAPAESRDSCASGSAISRSSQKVRRT